MPFISFIIPFFNRFFLLKKACDSILESDCKDIEIICIDDASTEQGAEEIYGYFSGNGINYIRLEKHSGPGLARNEGIKRAKGEWLFFLDSDDTIQPSLLKDLTLFLAANRGYDLVYIPNCIHVYPDGSEKIFSRPIVTELLSSFKGCQCFHFILNASLIKTNNIYFNELINFEDFCFVIHAFSVSNKIAVYPKLFYRHILKAPTSIRAQTEGNFCLNRNIRRKVYTHVKNVYRVAAMGGGVTEWL
jgi:glycosyltransferase involved in cell wall biosynthesis